MILISSVSDPLSEAASAHYSAAKAAVNSLARSIAADLTAYGIVANAVAPGWIHTEMVDEFARTATSESLKRVILLGRMGKPDDVASLVEYLSMDAPGVSEWIDAVRGRRTGGNGPAALMLGCDRAAVGRPARSAAFESEPTAAGSVRWADRRVALTTQRASVYGVTVQSAPNVDICAIFCTQRRAAIATRRHRRGGRFVLGRAMTAPFTDEPASGADLTCKRVMQLTPVSSAGVPSTEQELLWRIGFTIAEC